MSDSRIRVAFVSVSAALGGSEWVLLDFVSRAAGAGVEPLVILPREGPLLQALAERGVPAVVAQAPPAFLEVSRSGGVWAAMDLATGGWSWSRAIAAEIAKAF